MADYRQAVSPTPPLAEASALARTTACSYAHFFAPYRREVQLRYKLHASLQKK